MANIKMSFVYVSRTIYLLRYLHFVLMICVEIGFVSAIREKWPARGS